MGREIALGFQSELIDKKDVSSQLLVDKLDWKIVTHNLPLVEHKTTESGSGKMKQLWKIKGQKFGHFEVIGDDQNDADIVGWNCHEFDKQGNRVNPINQKTFCHQFFVMVLRNIVDKPDVLANYLFVEANNIHPQTASEKLGDISIETDGEFYFIRRISRM